MQKYDSADPVHNSTANIWSITKLDKSGEHTVNFVLVPYYPAEKNNFEKLVKQIAII
jgi:hypothetical protein